MMSALAIASGQAFAQNQWNSVDNLVNASESIKTTLDLGVRRVGGLSTLSGAGNIAPNGFMDAASVEMTYQQASDYNNAVGEVQIDIFAKTADEYFLEQYTNSQTNFSAAVDNFVSAAGVFITATYVNALAVEAQSTGDAVKGQALQNYVLSNNVLITNQNVDDYNLAGDMVAETAQQYAAVAAVYTDAEFIAMLQFQVDEVGQDYMNAGDAFFDNQTGTLNVGFTVGNVYSQSVDLTPFIGQTQDFINAGNASDFYNTGPTQSDICAFVGPSADPANICYVAPTP